MASVKAMTMIPNTPVAEEPKPDWMRRLLDLAKTGFLIGLIVLAWLWLVSVIVDLSILGVYGHFIDNVQARLRVNAFLANAISLILLVPFGVGVRYFLFSFRNKYRRNTGLAILLTMAVLYNLVLYFGTRNENIGPTGIPVKFYVLVPGGVVFSDRPGREAKYGKPFLAVTPENIGWLLRVKEGRIESIADPAHHYWFDRVTGDPLLWYYADSDNNFHFFDGPGYAPSTRNQLQPVTPEVRQRWEAKKLADEREVAERAAVLQRAEQEGIGRKAEERKRADQALAEQQRRAVQVQAEQRQAAQALADNDRRAGYMLARNLPSKVDFVVCAATAVRVPMGTFAASLVRHLNSQGKSASSSVFSPAFITSGAFDSFFGGRGGEDLQDMPVSRMGNRILLARININSVKPGTSAAGLYSASTVVAFRILSARDGSVVEEFELNAVGPGTNEADATAAAFNRILDLLRSRGF